MLRGRCHLILFVWMVYICDSAVILPKRVISEPLIFAFSLWCLSEETRLKIGAGVRMGWQRRREKKVVQETCHYEWQNLIAEASRQGYKGEKELQWDSYQILNEELKKEWLESVEQRKKMPRTVGSRRAPKSAEQRKKISESISAKWADPVRFVVHLPLVALSQTFFFSLI